MRILSGFILGLLLLMACRQGDATPVAEALPEARKDSLPLPPTIALSPAAQGLAEGWPTFNTLQQRMESVYRTQSREDMELLLEDLVEACEEIEVSEYPEPFNKPSVRSREKVFRTFLQKTQADLHYRVDLQESLVQALEAYNALRAQLNRVAEGDLDPSIFAHEKDTTARD
jgi:hypothetical protein